MELLELEIKGSNRDHESEDCFLHLDKLRVTRRKEVVDPFEIGAVPKNGEHLDSFRYL